MNDWSCCMWKEGFVTYFKTCTNLPQPGYEVTFFLVAAVYCCSLLSLSILVVHFMLSLYNRCSPVRCSWPQTCTAAHLTFHPKCRRYSLLFRWNKADGASSWPNYFDLGHTDCRSISFMSLLPCVGAEFWTVSECVCGCPQLCSQFW